ncbi:hypothetical protein M438DRAFT_383628 [Aureobasidium pullulans EXF-150]|uniref:JmjC domain-containing protein n=1 Tax=Aureobasidium pullulans EXF-150 TaxID=1043002 RepID=A0A074XCB9_AURPU|nr:uncharacterized protein M438DRAFT_383628 [Aureobasidium pullulans EXF-150]KEQ81389.1 hypothetical protein M438DRAFT_383628 [Aureobasidium pullulans EXF-150]
MNPNRRLSARAPFLLCYSFPAAGLNRTTSFQHIIKESEGTIAGVHYEPLTTGDSSFIRVYLHVIPKPGRILQKRLSSLAVKGVFPTWVQDPADFRDKIFELQQDPAVLPKGTESIWGTGNGAGSNRNPYSNNSDDTYSLLDGFLATQDLPIRALAAAFRTAILTQKVRLLGSQAAYDEPSLGSPRVYHNDDCWFTTPREKIIEGMVIANISRGEIRRRGDSYLVSGNETYEIIADVMRCLSEPDPSNTPFVFNIPMSSHTEYMMRVPEALSMELGQTCGDSDSFGAVLSPQYAFIDLHLGNAEHKFVTLSPLLEGGMYTVTSNQETLYIPCGWLHAVYTLSGGILVGINWVSEIDVPLTEQYFSREVMTKDCQSEDIMSFVHSLTLASQSLSQGRQDGALASWCRQRGTLDRLAKDKRNKGFNNTLMKLEKGMLSLAFVACRNCGGFANAHAEKTFWIP